MKNNKWCVAWLLLLLTGCQHSVQSPLAQLPSPSRIESLYDNRQLTAAELVDAISHNAMVIVGEKHDNPEHHRIEQWLISQLAAKRQQGSVLLEMITSEQQDAVNGVQQGFKGGAPYLRDRRLQELLQWNSGWPWPLYRDVVLTALQGNYPLLAANLSSDQVQQFYQSKQLPAGQLSAQPAVRAELSRLIVVMHDGNIDSEQLASMLAVQQQRDRFMAGQLLAAPKPALLIAGAYHAASSIGVPLHLRDLDPQARPVVVMLAEQGMTMTTAEADYVWYATPAGR